jgi:hypothetical protein
MSAGSRFSTEILLPLALLGLLTGGFGCGKAEPPGDDPAARQRDTQAQLRNALGELAGSYVGTLRDDRADRELPFRLDIDSVLTESGSPAEPPRVSARAWLESLETNPGSSVEVSLGVCVFDPGTGIFAFSDEEGLNKLSGTASGGLLAGTWTHSSRGLIGTFKLQRGQK